MNELGQGFNAADLERHEIEEADRELLNKKVLLSWRLATGELGHANVALTAENLYYALFEPDEVVEKRGIQPDDRFPDRIPTLTGHLSLLRPPAQRTSEEREEFRQRFVRAMRRAITSETDFAACLHDGALEQLGFLMDKGKVVIWTAGDMLGVPEKDIPGSYQQIKKVVKAGISRFRRQRWEDHPDRANTTRGDLLELAAGE